MWLSLSLLLADVLSEEAILKWYKDSHAAKGKSVFLEQMKKFVEWLQNAEEGMQVLQKCFLKCKLYFILSFVLLHIQHKVKVNWSKQSLCVYDTLWQSLNLSERISTQRTEDHYTLLSEASMVVHCSEKTLRHSSTSNGKAINNFFKKRNTYSLLILLVQVLCELAFQIFNWINPLVCITDFFINKEVFIYTIGCWIVT